MVSHASAQLTTDTTKSLNPKSLNPKSTKPHPPKRAALLSAIIPGAGQVYNKKYWKVPVIYVGFGALAYSFQFNQSRYVKYRDAYKTRIDNDSTTTDPYIKKYTDDDLISLFKYYHRYRDLTVIGGAAVYLFQIIDATVDAHMFTFNVDDDLSMNIHPILIRTASLNHYTTGLGLSIKF